MDLDQKIVEMGMFLEIISSLAKQPMWLIFTWLQMPPSALANSIW